MSEPLINSLNYDGPYRWWAPSHEGDMSQTPAAPAAAITPPQPPGSLIALPSADSTWQRAYNQPHALVYSGQQEPLSARSWANSSSMSGCAGHLVYQSLQRPRLLRGGEWQLSLYAMLAASLFGAMAMVQWSLYPLIGAWFFGWPVQWAIRRVAAHDPQYLAIYFKALKHPTIREAH